MRVITPAGLLPALLATSFLAGCGDATMQLPPLATSASNLAAAPRTNGQLGGPAPLTPQVAYGTARLGDPGGPILGGSGLYSLDFADTDIREAAGQILGTMLGLNYAIDPAVKGTVTMRTRRALTPAQLLPALQTLLGSVGAVLVQNEGLYRIVPAASAGSAGSMVIPLRFVSAEELAKVLQPVAGGNAKIAAETGLNTLLVSGDPSQVQSLTELIKTFDTDALAGQSYAVLPVTEGTAKSFAEAMTESFQGKGGSNLSGLLRVVPLPRVNAVLVVASQPQYIQAAQRVFGLIERQRRTTARSWHVYYLQNSNANDIAYTLQMAFTPGNVTALPQSATQGSGMPRPSGIGGGLGGAGRSGPGGMGGGAGGGAGAGLASGLVGGAGAGSIGGTNPLAPGGNGVGPGGNPPQALAVGAGNPLLGGLDQTGRDDGGDQMRILPNSQNNALLVYGTTQEEDTIVAMLRKVDIMPLQVRIDATIAEVTLNDTLRYGTQFFFKSGGINGILSAASAPLTAPSAAAFGVNFPGFFLGGNGQGGIPFAISALQAVTTVNVLSSPQLTVVDNQPARLQVGALVPYLTASSQSTLTANAPVINTIAYQPTGVIMEVTPRVNSGGLVTLDVSQEVSDVDQTANTNGINSPTFQERSITSRVVVQDGQTIGLAGLIRDNDSRGNQGIPWLKDIPILGALAGLQNNGRTRTELLVLITPHVIRDQNDARALTEDMRVVLRKAALVPAITGALRPSGSNDPNARVRDHARAVIERHTR
jgi:general secretion pathway protein D